MSDVDLVDKLRWSLTIQDIPSQIDACLRAAVREVMLEILSLRSRLAEKDKRIAELDALGQKYFNQAVDAQQKLARLVDRL